MKEHVMSDELVERARATAEKLRQALTQDQP